MKDVPERRFQPVMTPMGLTLQRGQGLDRLFNTGSPDLFVLSLLIRRLDPEDAKSLRGRKGRLEGPPDGIRMILFFSPQDFLPGGGVFLDLVLEVLVLASDPRKNGDEGSPLGSDELHILPRAELGVGDVCEIGATQKSPKGHPVSQVGFVIGDIAVPDFEIERNRPIATDTQAEQELLQIRAMVLVMPSPGLGRFMIDVVLSKKSDRRRVIMNPVTLKTVFLDSLQNHAGHEGGAIGSEESMEGSSDPVIVEAGDESGRNQLSVGGPFLDFVEGESFQNNIAEDDVECFGHRDLVSGICGHEAFQGFHQVELLSHRMHEREPA